MNRKLPAWVQTRVSSTSAAATWSRRVGAALWIALLLTLFLVGIRGMGLGVQGLGSGLVANFFAATDNPFFALVVGVLGTAILQSSSITTSMTVALVAAPDNPLPVENAIPIIMGANIGTTVTSSLVALGYVNRPAEFRRAFAVAITHDLFNVLAVAVMLPLEIATGALARTSRALADVLVQEGRIAALPNPVAGLTDFCIAPASRVLHGFFSDARVASSGLMVLSIVLILVCLSVLFRSLQRLGAPRIRTTLGHALDAHPLAAMSMGAILTVMVQSSSITTSLLVPLAAAGLLTAKRALPITLGANLGTTVTALLASLAATRETAELAVQVACVHVLFNGLGVLLIYPSESVRHLPVKVVEKLAALSSASTRVAALYVFGLFYALPAAIVILAELV